MGVHKKGCAQANGCCAQEAKQNQHDEPRLTWIIGKHHQTGNWVFVKEEHYKRVMRARILQKMDPRTKFLSHAEQIFGERLLQFENGEENSVRTNLDVLLGACAGRFWGLPEDGNAIYHKTQPSATPPPEIYQTIALDAFCSQYTRL